MISRSLLHMLASINSSRSAGSQMEPSSSRVISRTRTPMSARIAKSSIAHGATTPRHDVMQITEESTMRNGLTNREHRAMEVSQRGMG